MLIVGPLTVDIGEMRWQPSNFVTGVSFAIMGALVLALIEFQMWRIRTGREKRDLPNPQRYHALGLAMSALAFVGAGVYVLH